MFLATRKNVLGLGRLVPLASAIFGTGLIALGLSRFLWLSLLVMLFVGGAMMIQMAASNTILQTIVEDDKRGRVMSFYSMAFLGMAPFGSLLAGGLAHYIGAPRTVMISGTICICRRRLVRLPAQRNARAWCAQSTEPWASFQKSPPAFKAPARYKLHPRNSTKTISSLLSAATLLFP